MFLDEPMTTRYEEKNWLAGGWIENIIQIIITVKMRLSSGWNWEFIYYLFSIPLWLSTLGLSQSTNVFHSTITQQMGECLRLSRCQVYNALHPRQLNVKLTQFIKGQNIILEKTLKCTGLNIIDFHQDCKTVIGNVFLLKAFVHKILRELYIISRIVLSQHHYWDENRNKKEQRECKLSK